MADPRPEGGQRAATVEAATQAAFEVAATAGIHLGAAPVVLPGVANTVLGFQDAGIVVKVGTRPHAKARLPTEYAIAAELAEMDAPAPRPHAAVGPTVHAGTGFVVTMWHHVDHDPTVAPTAEACADALAALHEALDATTTLLPSFAEELHQARTALDNDDFMTELAEPDRAFLRDAYDEGLSRLANYDYADHRLHGEPHEANRLSTPSGVVWVDFESCCSGPREWDVAFLPPRVVARWPQVDAGLLACLRRLNRARLATWRWGIARDYPELRGLAEADLTFLKQARSPGL